MLKTLTGGSYPSVTHDLIPPALKKMKAPTGGASLSVAHLIESVSHRWITIQLSASKPSAMTKIWRRRRDRRQRRWRAAHLEGLGVAERVEAGAANVGKRTA